MEAKKRRVAAVAAGLLALLLQAPVEAQPTKLRIGTLPIIDTAPLQAAVQRGFFAAEGIEIDFTPTTSGATGLPAVAAGHLNIVISNTISTILGYDQGLGFQIIAVASGTGDRTPNSAGLVARKGSNLRTGKDFEGKRIATNARNNINWLMAREWVLQTGGSNDRITFLEVPFPNMIDALRGNQVDAVYVVEPFLSAGVAAGTAEVVSWPYDTFMKRLPIAHYATTRGYIEANPALIERWVRAYNRGIDWVNQNRGSEEWIKIIASYTKLTPDQLRNMALPEWEKTLDPAAFARMAALMRKHGMVQRDVDVKAMIYKTALK